MRPRKVIIQKFLKTFQFNTISWCTLLGLEIGLRVIYKYLLIRLSFHKSTVKYNFFHNSFIYSYIQKVFDHCFFSLQISYKTTFFKIFWWSRSICLISIKFSPIKSETTTVSFIEYSSDLHIERSNNLNIKFFFLVS